MKQAERRVVGQCQCDNDQRILAIKDPFLPIINREQGDVINKQGLIAVLGREPNLRSKLETSTDFKPRYDRYPTRY